MRPHLPVYGINITSRYRDLSHQKKWERSVIILSMIQAVRWKNQLFNLKWLHLTRLEKRFNRKFPMEVREKKDIAGPVLKPEKRQKDKGKVIFLNIKDEDKGK